MMRRALTICGYIQSHELRLNRALEHLQALDDGIRTWKIDAERLIHEPDPHVSGGVLLYLDSDVPVRFGVLVGDVAQCLRIALDNLAYLLILTSGPGLVSADQFESSEFPIFGTRPMTTREPGAQTIIEGLQPHIRGADYAADPLWQIHELSRVDKHRHIQVVSSAFASSDAEIGSISIDYLEIGGRKMLKGKTQVGKYRVRPAPGHTDVEMKLGAHVEVLLPEGGPGGGKLAVEHLATLRNYVISEVIDPLRGFL